MYTRLRKGKYRPVVRRTVKILSRVRTYVRADSKTYEEGGGNIDLWSAEQSKSCHE